jgi:hypothetical protein
MHVDGSISAALFALNRDARYSRPVFPPTHTVMSNNLKRLLSSLTALTTQGREIHDKVDLIRRNQEEQHNREMTDLRAGEYFAPPMHCDSALTLAQRSLKN